MEKLNQTLCNILNCTIYENPFDWDEVIRLCTLVYNSSAQESTGQTPYFMVYGWEATLPIDLASPTGNTDRGSYKNVSEYIQKLKTKLKQAHDLARDQNQKASIRQEKNYNNWLEETPYKVGSLVYYYNTVKGNSGKERFYKWRGPFVVVTKISERIYRLQENINSHPFITNHDRLKPAHTRKEIHFLGPYFKATVPKNGTAF